MHDRLGDRKVGHLATAILSESWLESSVSGAGSLPVGLRRKLGRVVDLEALGNGRYCRFKDQVRKLCLNVQFSWGKGLFFTRFSKRLKPSKEKNHFAWPV